MGGLNKLHTLIVIITTGNPKIYTTTIIHYRPDHLSIYVQFRIQRFEIGLVDPAGRGMGPCCVHSFTCNVPKKLSKVINILSLSFCFNSRLIELMFQL